MPLRTDLISREKTIHIKRKMRRIEAMQAVIRNAMTPLKVIGKRRPIGSLERASVDGE
jgi:hypothetical protein